MISVREGGEKTRYFFFQGFVSWEMVAILDFMALTKVHISLNLLVKMP